MGRPEDVQYLRLPAFGRWLVNTQNGRRTGLTFVLLAAVLGLVMGLANASELASSAVLVVFIAITLPVVFRMAIRDGRRRDQL